MVLMPGFQSTRLVTEGALEPFFFLYTDDSIQGNPETCKQSSIMLNYEVKNSIGLESVRKVADKYHGSVVIEERENTFIIKIILCDLSQKLHLIS